jgi:hypothetical protein
VNADTSSETPAQAQDEEVCPPHRWFIVAEHNATGGTETWTCTRCNEIKTIDRAHGEAARPPWTVGKAAPRPPKAE